MTTTTTTAATTSTSIELAPDVAARLREKAGAHGQSLPDFLRALAEREAGAPDENAVSSPPRNGQRTDGDARAQAATKTGDALDQAIARMRSRTPEEIAAMRDRVLAATPPPRPLPPGKTLFDVIGGQRPGDETDEEVRAALDELS
jgi:hypothetical protein